MDEPAVGTPPIPPLRKGWFQIDGQDGDRTVAEQMQAVIPALAVARGKTVLDLGCAEGLISREFARAGATVHGVDARADHLAIAVKLCRGLPVRFERRDLNDVSEPVTIDPTYDIVLALGVLHKLWLPERGLRWAASFTRDLLLLRSGLRAVGGVIQSKVYPAHTCDSHKVLVLLGFELQKVVPGPIERGENVEYWRRK